MHKRYKKLGVAFTGAVMAAIIALPVVFPEQVVAKRQTFKGYSGQAIALAATMPIALTSEEEPVTAQAATVIADAGTRMRVKVVTDVASPVIVAAPDAVETAKQQQSVRQGQETWRLDPVLVVKNNAAKYGFDSKKDTFTLLWQIYKGQYSGTGEAAVLVGHGQDYYIVQLIQPEGPGAKNIWQVNSIRQVTVTVDTGRGSKPDVGPGVEGLDYDKVIKWQQNVDTGRELWRLDPLQVAINEGAAYGFTKDDEYTIVKKLSSSPIARHGQINVEVKHKGQVYTMILVRPFGDDPGAIWTTYRVIGPEGSVPPVQKPSEKTTVLFETDEFKDWTWTKGSYPSDMAFATIVDYHAQLQQDKRIPAFVLEKAKDINYRDKVVLFAYLGTAPTGGYGIGIEQVTVKGRDITVKVRTLSPQPGQFVTLAQTHPADFVALDRDVFTVNGGVTVTFVDQTGKLLSKTKLVIKYR